MRDDSTTVMDLRQLVATFVKERRWEKFHTSKNLATSIAIEAAELMEHFQWLTPAEVKTEMKRSKPRGEVADEMADILAYLLAMGNVLNIDLASALECKVAKNAIKYPVKRYRGRFR